MPRTHQVHMLRPSKELLLKGLKGWRMNPDDGWWQRTYTKSSSNEWHLALVDLLFFCTCPNWCYPFDILSFLDSLALTWTTHSVSSFFCLFLRRIVETFRCRVSTLLSEVSFWGYDDLWHEMDRQIEETPMPLECRRTTKRSSWEDVATRRTPLQIPIRSIRLQKEDSRWKRLRVIRFAVILLSFWVTSFFVFHQGTRLGSFAAGWDFQDLMKMWCLLVWIIWISFK